MRSRVTVEVSDYAFDRTYALPQPMEEFVAEVRMPVAAHVKGWTYKDRLLKMGGSFKFEMAEGGALGTVVEMRVAPPGNAP